jgi:hypothetical protein
MKHLVDFVKACIEQKIALSEKEVMAIIEKSEQEKELCRIAFPLIKDQNNFMRLLESAAKMKNCDEKVALVLKYISTTKKTDDELFYIVKKANEHHYAYQHIYPALKVNSRTPEELLSLMGKSHYQWHFVTKIIPLLKLSKQKESFVWNLVKNSGFHYQASRHVIEFLSPKHALETISGSGFSSHICELGIKQIKKQEDIYHVIVRSKFDKKTCENGIPKLSEKKKMQLMKESSYDYNVCYTAIPTLKQAVNIRFVFEMLQKSTRSFDCEALITQCKDEKSLIELIKPHIRNGDIQKKALASAVLTSEDGIFFILAEGYLSEEIVALALKKLNLKKKNESQLLALMGKAAYNYEICKKIMPFLKINKKKDEEIINLIKQHGDYNENVCAVMITYLTDEEKILALLKRNVHNKHFNAMFTSVAKKLKTEKIENFFIECHSEDALVTMVPYIRMRTVLWDKLNKQNYSEKLCKKVTEFLSK